MYKKRNMRGGNSTSHSAEFYGGNSGSYFTNPPVAGGSAYGDIVPVSHGVIRGNVAGPNLAVYPGGSMIQTGGSGGCLGCGCRSKGNNMVHMKQHSKDKEKKSKNTKPRRSPSMSKENSKNKNKKSQSQSAGNRHSSCGRVQTGGTGCPGHANPRPQTGGARGCPYRSRRQRGGNHCGSHKKKKAPSRKRRPSQKRRPSNRRRSRKRHHVSRR